MCVALKLTESVAAVTYTIDLCSSRTGNDSSRQPLYCPSLFLGVYMSPCNILLMKNWKPVLCVVSPYQLYVTKAPVRLIWDVSQNKLILWHKNPSHVIVFPLSLADGNWQLSLKACACSPHVLTCLTCELDRQWEMSLWNAICTQESSAEY